MDFTDPDLEGLDHRDLEPYRWSGEVFFHDFIGRRHLSIAPDLTGFYVWLRWADRGPHDLRLEYRVTSISNRLQIVLRETTYDSHSSSEADLEEALKGAYGAGIALKAIRDIRLDDLPKRYERKTAEHHARACLELWRRAKIIHSEIESGQRDDRSIEQAQESVEYALIRADDAAAMLRSVAPSVVLAPEVSPRPRMG